MYNTHTMGHENPTRFTRPEVFSEIENFKYDLVENQIHGTIEAILTNGAAVSFDGSKIYYGVNRENIPERFRANYDAGYTFRCLPQELNIPVKSFESQSRLHVFPPNLHKKLAYTYYQGGAIGIDVIMGTDNNGKPYSYNLERTRDIEALTHVARLQVLKQGLDPVVCKPRRIVNEALKALAERKYDGGYGEYREAIKRMFREQTETVNKVEKFQNGDK